MIEQVGVFFRSNQTQGGGGALQHSMYPSSPSRPMAPGLARYGSAPSSLLNRHLQSLVPSSDAGFLPQFFPAAGSSDPTEQSSSGALERSTSWTAAPASSSSPTALARHSGSPSTYGFLSHLALDNNGESPTAFSRSSFFFFSSSSSSSPGSDSDESADGCPRRLVRASRQSRCTMTHLIAVVGPATITSASNLQREKFLPKQYII